MIASSLSDSVHVGPLILWVAIQIGVLAMGALGVRLWARQPMPAETFAVEEMVAVQIAATALLFPVLLPNAVTAAAVVALVWPFVQLAGLLSSTPQRPLWMVSIFISIWIVGLAWWAKLLAKCRAGMMLGICLGGLATLGGGMLWYLQLEAGEVGGGITTAWALGPLLGAVAIVQSIPIKIVWLEVAIPLGTAILVSLAGWNRQLIHRSHTISGG